MSKGEMRNNLLLKQKRCYPEYFLNALRRYERNLKAADLRGMLWRPFEQEKPL